MGYLVMAFIDLSSEEFLRAIRFFKNMCDSVDHVSLLIYVCGHGHGHHNKHHNKDYLIPINSRKVIHDNNHETHGLDKDFSLSSLDNLLENFIPDDDLLSFNPNKKYNIICLWDLCRNEWDSVEVETAVDRRLKDSLDYTVLYSCFAGEYGFLLSNDYPHLFLKKGSIFYNLFINNLKPGIMIYELGENINRDIRELKTNQAFSKFKLSKVKMNTTLNRVDMFAKAKKNKKYKQIFAKYYLPEQMMNCLTDNNDDILCSYRFTADNFLNSVVLELDFSVQFGLVDVSFETVFPLAVFEIESKLKKNTNYKKIRITNILELNRFEEKAQYKDEKKFYPIKIHIKSDNLMIPINLEIPDHYRKMRNCLYTDDINQFVDMKKKELSSIDVYSLSSADTDDIQSDSTTNDESET